MASKRRIRRKACEGKQRFDSQTKAVSAMLALQRDKGDQGNLRPYCCVFCKGWHYGHAPRRRYGSR